MNRKMDAYEVRAREICAAAGIDPESRIAIPGKARGMPAWCSYRDAARAEHVAAEQAKLAERMAGSVTTQPAEYADAPLRVFGNHEASTIAQMRNCMKVGNVVGGVIAADGHLGYAQPVGGVIAYENQISISGVGFDIGCFTGDTRIFTLDGKTPTLAEVEDEDVWVLSCDSAGKPVPAMGNCKRTRRDASLIKVTLDNGESIRCTPDHPFMLRNGTYLRAESLVSGQSLMPLYMTADKDGYVLVRNSATKCLMRLHYMVYRADLTEPCPDLAGDRLVIHHKNFVRQDNTPSNLVPMRRTDHDAMHAVMRDKAHFNEPEFQVNRIAAIKAFWNEARNDFDFMSRRRQTATSNVVEYMKTRPEHYRLAVKDNGKRGAEHLRAFNSDPQTIQRNKDRAGKPTPCPLCGETMVATSSLFYHARKAHPEALAAGARVGRSRGKNSVAERLVVGANNHKVVSVEVIHEQEDVFCLSVPGLNNFGLASGVFVHNCGNMAVRLDTKYADIADRAATILADIRKHVSFGVGRVNDEKVDHPLFDWDGEWRAAGVEDYRAKAKAQLGTVGSGNHYVDLMRDEAGFVWIGVHFGSRGLGHSSATRYLKLAGGQDGMNVPPAVVDANSELGQRYIAAMQLAGAYAYAGREWVVERVRQFIGGRVNYTVHNHHNYAWQEEHNGKNLWVVRKGATPAFPGQRGFIGGSMGDDAVIVEGVDSEASKASLYSTVHGAGRTMGRMAAKRTFSQAQMDAWLQERGVLLAGGDLDESPMAYRRLPDVLAHHAGTLKVLHTLTPFAVAMAGPGEFDPFKD